jgi:hypothetical protein
MNREANGKQPFAALDASLELAEEPMTRLPSLSPRPSASFFDPISTAC